LVGNFGPACLLRDGEIETQRVHILSVIANPHQSMDRPSGPQPAHDLGERAGHLKLLIRGRDSEFMSAFAGNGVRIINPTCDTRGRQERLRLADQRFRSLRWVKLRTKPRP
jgi:hypothetical protein